MSLLTLVGEAARVLSASHGPNSPLGITHSQTSPVHLLISSAFHSFGKSLLYPPLCPWYHPAFHTQLSFNSQPSVPPCVCFPLRKLRPAFCRLFEVAQDSCLCFVFVFPAWTLRDLCPRRGWIWAWVLRTTVHFTAVKTRATCFTVSII